MEAKHISLTGSKSSNLSKENTDNGSKPNHTQTYRMSLFDLALNSVYRQGPIFHPRSAHSRFCLINSRFKHNIEKQRRNSRTKIIRASRNRDILDHALGTDRPDRRARGYQVRLFQLQTRILWRILSLNEPIMEMHLYISAPLPTWQGHC